MLCVNAYVLAQTPGKQYRAIDIDTISNNSSLKKRNIEEAYIINANEKKTIYINEEVTTHIVMPESVKIVDISTKKVVGNQCEDNIVRIKPITRMFSNELAGTITIIGERHMVQYKLIYTDVPSKANSVYTVEHADLQFYVNPDVSMPQSDMAKYAWNIFTSKKKFYNIHTNAYGICATINNIYTVDDYFFIDFSLENKTKIKYNIDEIRLKLMDKKQSKATNSQTIELAPVWVLNNATTFKKGYRNIIVVDKLTFPNEKILQLELYEKQISGRVINLPIEYTDVLNADNFDESLIK